MSGLSPRWIKCVCDKAPCQSGKIAVINPAFYHLARTAIGDRSIGAVIDDKSGAQPLCFAFVETLFVARAHNPVGLLPGLSASPLSSNQARRSRALCDRDVGYEPGISVDGH